MPDPRLDEIFAEKKSALSDLAESTARCDERDRRDREFSEAWRMVFDVRGPGITDEDAKQIAHRFVILGAALRDRFWDFCIARRLRTKAFGHVAGCDRECELALRLLAHACGGNEHELEERARGLREFFPELGIAYNGLFQQLQIEAAQGLPCTPPLTMPEIARIAGVTRDKFRGDRRAGRWTSIDAKRYQRSKIWKADDPVLQAYVPAKIREKYPEKMWSD